MDNFGLVIINLVDLVIDDFGLFCGDLVLGWDIGLLLKIGKFCNLM